MVNVEEGVVHGHRVLRVRLVHGSVLVGVARYFQYLSVRLAGQLAIFSVNAIPTHASRGGSLWCLVRYDFRVLISRLLVRH